jgi:hypothetical protein
LLVYGAVAVTVASGLDYFFGLRKRINEAQAARREQLHAPGQAPLE